MKSKFKPYFLFLTLALFLVTHEVYSQEQAPPVDNTELKRPEPLFSIESNAGKELLIQISDTLKLFGFKNVKLDNRNMVIESKKMIAEKDFDKIIIWLEWDYSFPNKIINVYLLFGRFRYIISYQSKIRRIEVSDIEEDNIIGELKRSLISINN